MSEFVCVRCRVVCDTHYGARPAPRQGKDQPAGSLYCAECIADLEGWEREYRELRKEAGQ